MSANSKKPAELVSTDSANEIWKFLWTIAWGKIWSSRLLNIIELVLWCLLAGYMALMVLHLDLLFNTFWPTAILYWLIVFSSPYLIGSWIYKVHFRTGPGNEVLSGLPVYPSHVVGSRFMAILLSWLRIYIPAVILVIMLGETLTGIQCPDTSVRWSFYAVCQLGWMWSRYPGGILGIPDSDLNNGFALAILTITQVVGWIILPIVWGLKWGNASRNNSSAFLLYYVSHILIWIFLGLVVNYEWVAQATGFTPEYKPLNVFAVDLIFQSLVLVILDIILYQSAVKSFRRIGA
jgi:hypothetical protein